ncbi:MAG: smc, partial [Burkholderiales bacterium]|nr:smc [Burkholderiales bacterium]
GTGLGPRAYAIIEQGMISRVIEAKPDELRVFLEEAAGISKYKERRRETETRLVDTRENLSRINDIRLELATQLEKLEAQAKVATRYQEYQADLQLKQQLLWFLRRRDAAAERDRHTQEIGRATNTLEAENAELRSLESRLEVARGAHYQAGDALNAAQGALYAANASVASQESELRHVEETRSRLESQHTERRTQLAAWREQRSQLTQALHMWAARAGTARERLAEARRGLESENRRLPQAEEAFRTAQERLAEARSQLQQAQSRLQLEQANRAHLERAAQALGQRRERLETELQTLVEPDAAGMQALEASGAELEQSVRDAQEAVESLQAACAELDERSAAAAAALGEAEREHAAAEAQLTTLRQIQAAADENVPLREWLERHGLGSAPRLFQKLRIDAGWETAVESALRERLHALELADAGRVSELLADRPPTRASLFDRAESFAAPGVAGLEPLAAKVHVIDARVSGALADWLAGVYVVEARPDPATREALPAGALLVDREGHQYTRHTIGFHAPDQADAGLLARQAEIETTEARCAQLARSLSEARDRHARAQDAAAERAAELEQARDEVGSRQKARHDAQIEHLKVSQAQERFQERSAQVRSELEEVAQDAGRGGQALADSTAAAARIEVEIEAAGKSLEAARTEHSAAEGALAGQRRAAQQADREAQDALFGERECASKIAEIDHSVRVIDQQIERADQEVAALTTELADDPIPVVRQALDAAVEQRLACEKALAEARNGVEAAAGGLREIEETMLQVEARVAPLRERVGELRLKEQAAQISFEQFDTQLREAGAEGIRLAAEAERAPRPSSLQGELTRLTQAISELGAVNLAALEELRTSTERKG